MRYFKLYAHFLRFSFTKALQFRVDFTFRILMDLVYHILNLAFFKLLFNHTNFIGGWSESQVTLFVTSFILFDGIYMTVFATNAWWLPEHINKGELDHYLTKPVSPFFIFSFREFAANSFINLLFGIGIFIWGLTQVQMSFNYLSLAIYVLLLLNGTFLFYMMSVLMTLPVFWTQSPRGFELLLHGIDPVLKYPIGIQNKFLRVFFTFFLPMNLVCSLPAQFFFGENAYQHLLIIIAVTLIFSKLVLILWNKGLRQYSGASS